MDGTIDREPVAPGERVDVVVTGAAGLVGDRVMTRLARAGADAVGLDIKAGDHPTLRLDVTDGGAVVDTFERLRPRAVVHAAFRMDERRDPAELQRVNVGGTQNVLDAAANAGIERVVQISSLGVLGLDPPPMADEEAPLVYDSGSPYFDSKAAAEELARQAGASGRVQVIIVRAGAIWGPGAENWVTRPIEMMRRGYPILMDGGRGLMAHCWIDNLVDAVMAALDRGEAGTFQVHDGSNETTYAEYFKRLARAAGIPEPRHSLPKSAALAVGAGLETASRISGTPPSLTRVQVHLLCRQATYSIARAREVLGYEPAVDLDRGMAILTEHFRGGDPNA